jgi:predicted O-linked N-acetylglucosamine transferase (SPINDLY family)
MALGSIPKRTKKEKIRVGYFSADFGDHPVSFLSAELFETHNKNKFELIAFSFGPHKPSQMRDRLVNAFDQFIDVSKLSDQAVAELARKLEIDIAIDLGGFTGSCRMGIFAFRAAPIQASYIGYLGTLGASYYDYLIADKTIVPTHLKEHYSEKIMYLQSYQVNDSKRKISNRVFSREELDLPPTGFVFCCFNNNYKILPQTFDSWVKILKAVDSSVLMLVANNPLVQSNLKKEAALRGIDPNRLVFGKRIPREDYLARYKSCDLFLDTYPYNAGTTASDALWSHLPVLTLMGQSFASRVAASLLHAIGLPVLITSSSQEYESLAIELATSPHKLNQIKQKLVAQRLSTPLFNTPLFTKHLESAYTDAIERYWADLPPEDIEI